MFSELGIAHPRYLARIHLGFLLSCSEVAIIIANDDGFIRNEIFNELI